MQNDTIPHHSGAEHGHYKHTSAKPDKEGWRSIASTLAILLAAPLVAIILTAFVFQSYQVEGPSMETSLQNGDRLVIWKLGKTWNRLAHNDFVPKRGQVIVFHRPSNIGVATEGDKQLIKRVVALPGERVVITNGVLVVYNDDHPKGFQPDQTGQYNLHNATTAGEVDVIVPAGKVFVCGDNRDNSLDSRNFGPISTKLIVGNLALRLYPLNKFDTY
jgi:signal peptidase I